MNRRTFIGRVGAGVLAAPAAAAAFAQQRRIDRIGMQLYTVRDAMAKDFEGTLARVAGLGYKEVEFAGYFDHKPADVKAALSRHGLTSPSTHVGYDLLGDRFEQVVQDSLTIGHTFIVNPWIDESVRKQPGAWQRATEAFNRAGEISRKAGIQFAYHNHHFEFVPVDGTTPMNLIFERCDPSLVKIELDLCWTSAAGQDPVALFQKHPGRFPMVHVKDLKKIPPGAAQWKTAPPIDTLMPDVADAGAGTIDWARIFAHSQEGGVEHYFVEHDQPASPFDSLKASYTYLEALRF